MEYKHTGLMAKGGLLLAVSGVISVLLFCGLFFGGGRLMDRYFEKSNFNETQIAKRINDLQKYVDENQIAATESHALTQWALKHPMILFEIYRHNLLLYTSAAPDEFEDNVNEVESPYYDWLSYYTVTFSDGDAQVVIYANDTVEQHYYLALVSAAISVILFFLIFLWGCRRVVRYICQLSNQIQAMETGDLDVTIPIQGNHELTLLSKSIDSMRKAFKEQREREAVLYHAHQAMITEMSHDLRTPLTSLQIYTDILRYKKYDPAQLDGYLEKIDIKAKYIKQLADNIFEYSLISGKQQICLEPLSPFRQVFHDLLSEYVSQWGQQGFRFLFDLDWPDVKISVYPPYLTRLMDNLSSNLNRYADADAPVRIHAFTEGKYGCLCLENMIRKDRAAQNGTHIGLPNIRTMMEQMNGFVRVEDTGTVFSITLYFPSEPQQE